MRLRSCVVDISVRWPQRTEAKLRATGVAERRALPASAILDVEEVTFCDENEETSRPVGGALGERHDSATAGIQRCYAKTLNSFSTSGTRVFPGHRGIDEKPCYCAYGFGRALT